MAGNQLTGDNFRFPSHAQGVCVTINEVPEFVRTLFASGFDVLSVTHQPNFTLVDTLRSDEFGLAHGYTFAYAGAQPLSKADKSALCKRSRTRNAPLVLVSDLEPVSTDPVVLSRAQFFGKVGGPISSVLALEPSYSSRLTELGLQFVKTDANGGA